MKKHIALSALMICSVLSSFAQKSSSSDNTVDKRSTVEKPSRDFIMIKLTNSAWANTPDTINTKGIGKGFAFDIMYDFPVKKSKHFSVGVGLGINAQNVYLDKQAMNFKDTGSQVIFNTNADYKRYKFTTTRLEMPIEIRFFGNNHNRNRGFKAAIGTNIGLILNAHTKGTSGSGGSKFNDKVVSKRFMQQWNFAPTCRIGYGNFSFYASYSLTPLFKDAAGPQVAPYSFGICISGL
jgi:hypothetical protein